ncbi:MAG: hypothetical protein ACYC4B_07445, partial [Pirellulaceae bacterium]
MLRNVLCIRSDTDVALDVKRQYSQKVCSAPQYAPLHAIGTDIIVSQALSERTRQRTAREAVLSRTWKHVSGITASS